MKTKLKMILMAVIIAIGQIFAIPALTAKGKVGKSGGFGFLPAVIFAFGLLMGCGGGGDNSVATATPQTYNLVWSGVTANGGSQGFDRIMINESLIGSNGRTVSQLTSAVGLIPTAASTTTVQSANRITVHSYILNASMANAYGVAIGSTVRESVYLVDFSTDSCRSYSANGRSAGQHYRGITWDANGWEIVCNFASSGFRRMPLMKESLDPLRVCVRDMGREIRCEDFSPPFIGSRHLFLAFPDQTYRRDNGECESAPFYAVGNCQSENVVDVGNFAAFVSGLDGNGYRQFGVRHQWKEEDWNAAAMVSHAKGREFLDTWWGRLRFEHSVFDDAAAFAEYESGITSLRQNGFMFADIPISGGRIGFRFDDFTASFGRPMHYKGKGENAAAVHYQHSKETELQFRSHNNNAEILWQWQRRF